MRLVSFVLDLQCWTETRDVHGFYGIAHNIATLAECQAVCVNNLACVAIDWQPTNAPKTCWILTSTVTRNTTQPGVITHYKLHRDCLSKSCFYETHVAFHKSRVAPYSITSVLHGADPGFLAVSPQVTLVINPVVGCGCFPSGWRLLSPPRRSLILADTKLHCLVTKAHRCSQIAQGHYAVVSSQDSNPLFGLLPRRWQPTPSLPHQLHQNEATTYSRQLHQWVDSYWLCDDEWTTIIVIATRWVLILLEYVTNLDCRVAAAENKTSITHCPAALWITL